MRTARILGEGEAYYHIISRIVDRRMVLDEGEKERFRELMRKVEGFCGVQILTYAILDNHWHIALRVPVPQPVSDEELVRRLGYLYDKPEVDGISGEIAALRSEGRDTEADGIKARYTRRMCNLSEFAKTLKQRFSQSFNRRHGRKGTLWESRFKSLLIEGSRRALWILAVYIDLNAVRAGIVSDPQDYRFCGYAEAVAGGRRAQEGLTRVTQVLVNSGDWSRLGRHYRRLLYTQGEQGSGHSRRGIDPQRVQEVLNAGGRLGLREVLRCQVRYFSDGMILGSRVFVDDMFSRHRENFGVKRTSGARPMRGAAWRGLYTARRLQLDPVVCCPVN